MIVPEKAKLARSQNPDSQDTQGKQNTVPLSEVQRSNCLHAILSQVWRKRNKDWNFPVYTKDIRRYLQMQSLMPTWCSKRWWQIDEVVAEDRDFLRSFHYIFPNISPGKNWQSFSQPPLVDILVFPFLYPPLRNKQMGKESKLSSETGAGLDVFSHISGLGNEHPGLVTGVELWQNWNVYLNWTLTNIFET